ncbi:MAG: ComF family protein [bacterium]
MFKSRIFSEVVNFVKEGIAPSRCAGCGVVGSWLCESCAGEILWLRQQNCYRCGRLTDGGRTCDNCRRRGALTGVVVAAHFEMGPVRELVHQFKYNGAIELAPILGEMLALAARDNNLSGAVVPVPLHRKRQRDRGFNQAELLAKHVAGHLGLPYCNILRRVKPTITQTELSRPDRMLNVSNAFICAGSAPKEIILIDDVMTTGATLQECAKVLRGAGVKKVQGLVVARG